MLVLVVPSFGLLRVGSGGFLGGAFLLQGFGGLGAFLVVGVLVIVAVALFAN